MANLDDEGEGGVSLFPMFNILACTLGVMVFVLATVAIVSLGADKAVEFVSAEGAEGPLTGTATWFEWDGSALTLHPNGASVRFTSDLRSIRTFEATYAYMFGQVAGTALGAQLAAISLDSSRYIILLVRPSGFRTIPEVRGYLELLGIEVTAEPIDQGLRRIRVE